MQFMVWVGTFFVFSLSSLVTEMEVLNYFMIQCSVLTSYWLVYCGSRDLMYCINKRSYAGVGSWGLKGRPALAESLDAEDFSELRYILLSAAKQAEPSRCHASDFSYLVVLLMCA